MIYRKKDIIIAIILTIFIISFAIVFTVFFKPLYYFDINYLNIDELSGLSSTLIKKNYDILINYQSIFYQGDLYLPDFTMSVFGKIHFEEVKRIFEIIQILMISSGLIGIFLVTRQIRKKEYRFFRLTGILSIILPLFLGILSAIDFDKIFIIFHRLIFRNDYWIFDAQLDPVITILPENFFFHCLILIIFIVIFLATCCLLFYRFKQRKIISDTNL